MKALVRTRYGLSEVLEVMDVEKPVPADNEVLVKVRASSINAADWYEMAGKPLIGRTQMGMMKPKSKRLGVDFAGTVEAVGKDVLDFKPGDEVFGGRNGALAEYVCVRNAVVLKPANVTFEEAAAVPVAAITALQGLRDKGNLQPGQKVLVYGASGGVGTYTVQIAKALGAEEVTAVCSTDKVEVARSIGADHVIDYTREDFTKSNRRYDLMANVSGGRPWAECKRVLTPEGTLVILGAPKAGGPLGPLGYVIRVRLASLLSKQKVIFFIAQFNRPDMKILADMLESGKIKSVIDRRFALSESAAAFAYFGEGHARGKVVIEVSKG
ncbi:MAG: NAD(P)-dependent alcohol dehydrogenase [Anaerolineae bacterium]|nr:MAG: NAD(P)-dependent alcohol dehydrogenase [Anaerolineae bacterium]